MQRRTLEGCLGVHVHFSHEHFARKRVGDIKRGGESHVVRKSDPDAFNFTKIQEEEVLYELEISSTPISVIVCASPLLANHVLFVPERSRELPQVLTEELLHIGLQLSLLSGRKDFRLLFNSLGGYASVNHFHFHGLYLEDMQRLPVEDAQRSRLGGARGELLVEILVDTAWFCRGLVLSAADVDTLALFGGRVLRHLQAEDIAHNLMVAPSKELPVIYLFPRQWEEKVREKPGFNAAILEIAGLLFAHDEERFKNFDEDQVSEIFREDVSLSSDDFDNLLCKIAWLVAT